MTIAESVKQLLEARNRVILPGFGNLEVKESGGGVSSSAKRIDPPGLMVRFDGSYSKDDGLLATAFSMSGGVNREEAEQQVLELVDAIRFALDKGERYPLGNTGIFSRDDEGKIHFLPDSAWVLEPDQYGLDSMDLLELEDLPFDEEEALEKNPVKEEAPGGDEPGLETGPLLELSEEEEADQEEQAEEIPEKPLKKAPAKPLAKLVTKEAPKPLSKRISKPRIHEKIDEVNRPVRLWKVIWILAGILIVVLVVLLIVPNRETLPPEAEQPAQAVQEEVGTEVTEQEIPVTEPEDPLVDETDPDPFPEEAEKFVIIAGSFRNLANASELQDKLKAKGYPAEVMITENRMYRVSVASYPSSREAERALENLKGEPGMESCWLLSNE